MSFEISLGYTSSSFAEVNANLLLFEQRLADQETIRRLLLSHMEVELGFKRTFCQLCPTNGCTMLPLNHVFDIKALEVLFGEDINQDYSPVIGRRIKESPLDH